MPFRKSRRILASLLIAGIVLAWLVSPAQAGLLFQLPTINMATVTGTPIGPYIVVNSDQEQINVRSLPDPLSTKVGILLTGQQAPAKGRVGQWILIVYPGIPGDRAWVYAPLVTLHGGDLPIVEAPPTLTPLYTATIDPTLAAQFIITVGPTRLPTFTQPPQLVIPTLIPESRSTLASAGLPIGLIIVGVGAVGIFLALLSLIRGR
jgi:hypothetical protein